MKHNLKIITTTILSEEEKAQVFDLWNREYPEKLCYNSLADFNDYLEKLADQHHFLMINNENKVLGWALTFDRENERWFAIIIADEMQDQGFGRKMLNHLKEQESFLNGWVIDQDTNQKKNGKRYRSPLKFYEKCDFEILASQRIELPKISAVKIKWTKPKS